MHQPTSNSAAPLSLEDPLLEPLLPLEPPVVVPGPVVVDPPVDDPGSPVVSLLLDSDPVPSVDSVVAAVVDAFVALTDVTGMVVMTSSSVVLESPVVLPSAAPSSLQATAAANPIRRTQCDRFVASNIARTMLDDAGAVGVARAGCPVDRLGPRR